MTTLTPSIEIESHREIHGNTIYSDTTRLATLAYYAETGNASEAARSTGVSESTADRWIADETTPELLSELRNTIRYNCGWLLASLVSKSLHLLERKLDSDTKLGAKDTAIIASILIDKHALVSGYLMNERLSQGVNKLSAQLATLGDLLTTGGVPKPSPDPEPGAGKLGLE